MMTTWPVTIKICYCFNHVLNKQNISAWSIKQFSARKILSLYIGFCILKFNWIHHEPIIFNNLADLQFHYFSTTRRWGEFLINWPLKKFELMLNIFYKGPFIIQHPNSPWFFPTWWPQQRDPNNTSSIILGKLLTTEHKETVEKENGVKNNWANWSHFIYHTSCSRN